MRDSGFSINPEDRAVTAEPKQRLWHYRRLACGTDHFFDQWATVPGSSELHVPCHSPAKSH